MSKKWIGILFGAMLTLSACGTGDTTDQLAGGDSAATGGGEVTAAEKIYQKSCSTCHGGKLQGGVGPQLTQVGNKYSSEEILNIIENGQGRMPKGILQGEDAEAVAVWLAEQK
ncbi:cytochrome c551 [Bacillus salitolerans]|uniref:Cytochrome c551 n=1 Tax=Bacillus salitolerans TaxID=1437434 RepID=A0ABW4LPD7_9BACI